MDDQTATANTDMYQYLAIRREGPVEFLILNRPEVRNAFNDEVIAELTTWAARAAADSSLRAVVLAGAGPAFSAGADVRWMAKTIRYSEDENRRDARAMSSMFGALDTLPVPLIGRIHGPALGGGTGLTAVCDIAVASDDAVFGFTEARVGIVPAVISPFTVEKIGVSAARRWMLTGARFDAHEALRIGLVHAVVPAGELDATVDAVVKDVLECAPTAVAIMKSLIPRVAGRAPAEVRDLTSQTIAAQRVSPEGQDGLTAFVEKRQPRWRV